MIYSITYELRSKDKDYTDLLSYIGTKESKQALSNMWLIYEDKYIDLNDLCNTLRGYMDEQDLLFVSRLAPCLPNFIHGTDGANGWLDTAVWKWYNDHIDLTNDQKNTIEEF